jgi:5S rRNA maturation endonuclease (ribonuclease M5)
MNKLNKRIDRIEKSLPVAPKVKPVIIFLDPGETKEQKIAEYENTHGQIDRDTCWIIRFADSEVENVQEKETENE